MIVRTRWRLKWCLYLYLYQFRMRGMGMLAVLQLLFIAGSSAQQVQDMLCIFCAGYLAASSDSWFSWTAGNEFAPNLLCRLSSTCVRQLIIMHNRYRTCPEFTVLVLVHSRYRICAECIVQAFRHYVWQFVIVHSISRTCSNVLCWISFRADSCAPQVQDLFKIYCAGYPPAAYGRLFLCTAGTEHLQSLCACDLLVLPEVVN